MSVYLKRSRFSFICKEISSKGQELRCTRAFSLPCVFIQSRRRGVGHVLAPQLFPAAAGTEGLCWGCSLPRAASRRPPPRRSPHSRPPGARSRPRCLRRPGAGVAALRHGRPRPSPPLPSLPVPFGPRGTHRVRGGAEVLEGQRAEDEAREQGRGALALHAPQWRHRRAARSPQRPAAAGQGRAGPGRAGSSPRVLLAMGSGSRRQGHRGFCASGKAVFGFTAHHDGR